MQLLGGVVWKTLGWVDVDKHMVANKDHGQAKQPIRKEAAGATRAAATHGATCESVGKVVEGGTAHKRAAGSWVASNVAALTANAHNCA